MILPIQNERPRLLPNVQTEKPDANDTPCDCNIWKKKYIQGTRFTNGEYSIEKPDNFSSLDDAYQRLKESLERGDKSMYENVLQEFHTWCEVIQMQREIAEIKTSRR